jgi:hypothetical protein
LKTRKLFSRFACLIAVLLLLSTIPSVAQTNPTVTITSNAEGFAAATETTPDRVTTTFDWSWFVPSPYTGWSGEAYVDVYLDYEYEEILIYPFMRRMVSATNYFRIHPSNGYWTLPNFSGSRTTTNTFDLFDHLPGATPGTLQYVNITFDYYAHLFNTVNGNVNTWQTANVESFLGLNFTGGGEDPGEGG